MTPRNRPSRPLPRPTAPRGGWSGGPIKDDGPDPWFIAAVVVGLLILAGVGVSAYLTLL
jgi:hypothetical protein